MIHEPSQQPPKSTLKFLCSYGGKILPRFPDAKLRYVGGHTRVLSVHPSISFSDLTVKLEELCGSESITLRCQLPTEDLDALVSVRSDEDLVNLIDEYKLLSPAPSPLKVRAFLSPSRSSSTSTTSSSTWSSSSSHNSTGGSCGCSTYGCSPRYYRCVRQMAAPVAYDVRKSGVRNIPLPHYAYPASSDHIRVLHNWQ